MDVTLKHDSRCFLLYVAPLSESFVREGPTFFLSFFSR